MHTLILDALEATGARLPDKTAFIDEETSVTFSRLIALSRAVGSALSARVAPRTVVGFYMDKSCATVAGFLGAVYAGCAYAQLNLRHPAARVRAILDTLAAPVVVTDRAHEAQLRAMDDLGALILGAEKYQKLLDHVTTADGRQPPEAVDKELGEILEAFNQGKN